jgi:hypothetical protein
MVVGVAWMAGCTALIYGSVSWCVADGMGRARGYYISSMSVSLGGSELEYFMFLVSTVILIATVYRRAKKGKNYNLALWLNISVKNSTIKTVFLALAIFSFGVHPTKLLYLVCLKCSMYVYKCYNCR